MAITRRGFVQGAGLAATAIAGSAAVAFADGAPEVSYDYEADVVVVGAGPAGLLACATAHDAGASTLLIEKNSSMSVRGDALLEEFPFAERTIELYSQMASFLEEEFGVEFFARALEIEGAKSEYDDGNGPSPCTVQPAGRAWYVKTPIVITVDEKMNTFDDFTELLGCEAVGLVQDEVGRVTGVRFIDPEGMPRVAHANKGVILATGSFCASPSLISQLVNPHWAFYPTAYAATNSGDGIRMAREIGVDVAGMDLGFLFLPVLTGTSNMLLFDHYLGNFSTKEAALAENVPVS